MAWDDACGLIASSKQGTGYLVSLKTMVTCQHVVGSDTEVRVRIGGKERTGAVVRKDAEADIALVELSEPVAGIEPLHFARACPTEAKWQTFGYPGIARGMGIPMSGYVAKADGMDSLGQPAVLLYADQVRSEGPTVSGFSGSPVVVNGMVVGTIKRILENPDRKGWPLYGLVWATPSRDILAFLRAEAAGDLQAEATGVDRMAGILNELESIVSPTGVYALWNSLADTGITEERVSLRAAELLGAKGRPELAFEVARAAGDGVAARRLRARVVGKMGRIEESIQLLEQLEKEGNLDSDSGGILAGRYRQMSETSGETDNAWRRKSFETYQRYWRQSGDTYCGVNAAAMALQEGEVAECARIAGKVLDKMEGVSEDTLDYWGLATLGEAWLLLGNTDKAADWYRKAKAAAAGNYHDIAVMWKGAVRDLEKLGKPRDLLDKVLRPPRVTAFFGHSPPRLPPGRLKETRAAIAATVRERSIGYGVCSACRGSDLLFLDELIKRNGRATVVLTNPREEFAQTFVGSAWQPIFDDVMNSGRVEVRVLEGTADAWIECRKVVRAEVKKHAKALDCDPLLLVVWDGEPSYVADSVELWEASGDPVEKIAL